MARSRTSVRLVASGAISAAALATSPALAYVPQEQAIPAVSLPDVSASSTPDAAAEDALTQAEETGHRVEDKAQRDAYTKVYANPDGTWTAESAPSPIHARDDDGRWSDVDTTLVPVPGGYAPKNTTGGLTITDGSSNEFAAMRVAGKDLAWTWPGNLPSPQVEGNTATFQGVLGEEADLVVTATATGFRHDIVLNERPDDVDLAVRIPIESTGPRLVENAAGSMSVETQSGTTVLTAAPPVMYDATRDRLGEPTELVDLDAAVANTSSGATLTLSPDAKFLADPTTQYPVTIDPTFTTTPSADTFVGSADTSSRYPQSEILRVGTDNGGTNKYRTFMKFPDTPWSGTNVSAASLRLFNFNGITCNGSAVRVSRLTQSYNNGQHTWATPASWTQDGLADSTQAYGASGCAAADMTWDVTAIVRAWASGASPNHGLNIKAVNEGINSGFRAFRSEDYSDPAKRPRLTVTYNSPASTPTELTVDDQVADPESTATAYASAPVVSALMEDLEGDPIEGEFSVINPSSPSAPVWSGTAVRVSGGGSLHAATIPAGTLAKNTSYQLRARSREVGGAWSPNATLDFKYFDVQTTTPTSVVTESVHPISIAGLISANGTPIANGTALVEVWPDGDYLAALPDGAQLPIWRIGNVPTDAQGRFSITFTPGDLPNAFESDRGYFNVSIDATNGTNSTSFDIPVTSVPQPVPYEPGQQSTTLNQSASATQMRNAGTAVDASYSVALDIGTGNAIDVENPPSSWEQTPDESGARTAPTRPGASASDPQPYLPMNGRDQLNVLPETTETTSYRDVNTSDANAEAAALLAAQSGNARQSSASIQTSQSSAIPAAGGCQVKSTGNKKLDVKERFGSIYNWRGAKAKWSQSTETTHFLGIAIAADGGYRASGTGEIGGGNSVREAGTARNVVNKNAYNEVDYKQTETRCGGRSRVIKWVPVKIAAPFTDFTKSESKNWNNRCVGYNDFDFIKDSGTSYTKSTGVDLLGVLKLSAQSGYNAGTSINYEIRKPSLVCSSSSSSIWGAPAVQVKKDD